MLFVVQFEDDPAADPEIRRRHMAAHLDYLESRRGAVIAAGPLLAPGGAAAGGMWLVEAAGEAEVEALVRADPFWPTGLRLRHRILAWRRVFAEGRRLVEPG